MKNPNAIRRGFTLVEFLVVSGIAFSAMALAPSAIQQARESARRTMCKNNLKMMGIALHTYHEVHGSFPPGWNAHTTMPGTGARIGWQSSILPFVDQGPIYDLIDFEKDLPAANDLTDRVAGIVLQTPIEVYRCPADPISDTNPMRGDYGTSNYSGNHGNLSLPRWTTGRATLFWPGQIETPQTANGMMYWNSRVRVRDITDGLSNTLLVGERSVTSAAGIWPGVGANNFENDAVTECSHGSRINQAITSFSSAHEGGAQFLMGDGSVHFLSETIDSQPVSEGDLGLYQRLSNRHDGLPIGSF